MFEISAAAIERPEDVDNLCRVEYYNFIITKSEECVC